MSATRLLGAAVAVPLLLLGIIPTASAEPDSSEDPAPVQRLSLTTPSGQATDAGRSGLDDAAEQDGAQGAENEAEGQADQDGAEEAGKAEGAEGAGGTGGTAEQAGAGSGPTIRTIADTEVHDQDDLVAEAAILTDPLEVNAFVVAGFTWSGELPQGAQIYLRMREQGSWSPWYPAETADGSDEATSGTAEIITGGADAVQASVVSDADALPADLHLELVPAQPEGAQELDPASLPTVEAEPTEITEVTGASIGSQAQPLPLAELPDWATARTAPAQPADQAPAGQAPVVTTAAQTGAGSAPSGVATGLPVKTWANGLPVGVTTRAEWGANEANMSWSPSYVSASHVVVHHTAGGNSYTAAQSPSIVRGIYHYHAVTLGWGDIGYNFLIDKYGQVFEGRSGSTRAGAGQMVIGGHARGANTGTMGLSMMGDYSNVTPSSTQIDAVGKMAGWFLGRAGVSNASGSASFTIRTTDKYQAGTTLSLPRIIGHRDVGATACPGARGYASLGTIRSIAQNQLQGASRWVNSGGKWYYQDAKGNKATGWISHSGSWYYLGSDGAMVTGWAKVGGSWYYLSSSGAMVTGWAKVGGSWYYLASSGAMVTGWAKVGGTWYHLGSSGAMTTGWLKVGGSWYYLSSSGAMVTGWAKVGGTWYHFGSSGAMTTGWLKDGGSWYYLSSSGAMVTGTVSIGGVRHSFNSSGVWTGQVAQAAQARQAAQTAQASQVRDGWTQEGNNMVLRKNGAVVETQALRPIMSGPTASRATVINKMVSVYASSGRSYPSGVMGRGGAPTPTAFFTMVYDEAVAEGVSPELLFAQVVKETGWLQFTGDVKASQFNFGGIGATGGGVAGHSFKDVRTGLRAQVQHLRAYGDAKASAATLKNPVVDPRFSYVRKGSARHIQHLGIQENPSGGGWAASRHYGIELVQFMTRHFG
ncbi:N-acetylmuramoyl-L-alanine amidase [Actinomyces slackii]|uniref:Autolysin n=1 Tax=Actinomyces slackii TaxID=52774 RepID=A0A448KG47_9ACTO|nr:N-acetylmuramoyl-L-alanine amidase [Actinomyces slackii]VEG75872.1 Autolysin [Actinomyces slackii]